MEEKLIETICSMLVNVLSSAVYDTGKRALKAQQGKQDPKLDAINVFMEASGYEMLYENSMFAVYHVVASMSF